MPHPKTSNTVQPMKQTTGKSTEAEKISRNEEIGV
jgi:hypothetical protein